MFKFQYPHFLISMYSVDVDAQRLLHSYYHLRMTSFMASPLNNAISQIPEERNIK